MRPITRKSNPARAALLGWMILCLASSASAIDVAITEIMYHPEGDNDAAEFIEIYRPSDATGPLDLEGWWHFHRENFERITALKPLPKSW